MAVPGRARFRRLAPERQLAVDLGTANTVVARRGEGIVLFEPSVVAVDELSTVDWLDADRPFLSELSQVIPRLAR